MAYFAQKWPIPIVLQDLEMMSAKAVRSRAKHRKPTCQVLFFRTVFFYTFIEKPVEDRTMAPSLSSNMSRDRNAGEAASERDAIRQVHAASLRLQAETTEEGLLQTVVDSVQELAGAGFINLQIYEPATRTLHSRARYNMPALFQQKHAVMSEEASTICGTTSREKCRVIVADVANDPIFARDPETRDFVLSVGILSGYAVPLLSPGEKSLLGVLAVYSGEVGVPDENTLFLIDLVAVQTAALLERIRTASRLKAAERAATIGELAIAMAHEINNPLQALTNLLQLMSSDPAGRQCAEYTHESLQQVNRISGLVSQVNQLRPGMDKHLHATVSSLLVT